VKPKLVATSFFGKDLMQKRRNDVVYSLFLNQEREGGINNQFPRGRTKNGTRKRDGMK